MPFFLQYLFISSTKEAGSVIEIDMVSSSVLVKKYGSPNLSIARDSFDDLLNIRL